MRVAVIADQHGSLPTIPECDLMIVSGDICGGPAFEETWRPDLSNDSWAKWVENDFTEWVSQVPHAIIVAGNHDTAIEKRMCKIPGNYLLDSGCNFGGLDFWGAPWVRKFDNLAFNLTDAELEKKMGFSPKRN